MGAAIVLSSSWRTDAGKVAMLNGLLQQRRIDPIYDCTLELDGPREAEICDWLDRHPGVTSWIAVDDMDLTPAGSPFLARMQGHVVQTSSNTGLTTQDAELCIRLLLSHQGRYSCHSNPVSPLDRHPPGSPTSRTHSGRTSPVRNSTTFVMPGTVAGVVSPSHGS